MKKLHQRLSNRYSWYAKWHRYPHHGFVHIVALLLIIAFIGAHANLSVASTDRLQASQETLAQANGVRLLKEGEYAFITTGTNDSRKTIKQSFTLKSGDIVTFDVDPKGATTLVEPQDGVPTYVPNNANVVVKNIADFTSYDESGKIDTAIERELKHTDKVSVIIRLKLPGRFYDTNDTAANRSSKSQAFANAKASVASAVGGAGKVTKDLQIINGIALDVSSKALDGLRRNPNVDKVDLDRTAQAYLDTSVAEINAPSAWSMVDNSGNPITGFGMRIAVIDTGVDYTHPDLGGCLGLNCKVIGGWDFVNNDADPMDDMGHGTHVAATAAGRGLLNGVAPDASIIAYKVLDAGGSGSFSNVIAALQRATDPNQDGNPADHVDIATMSLGAFCGTSYTAGCGPDDDVSLAVDNASAAGVINTIAAGNSGPGTNTVGSPGAARSAITVAAACKAAQVGVVSNCTTPIASFSSRGPVIDANGVDLKKPDIAAPGVLICAARWSTSFSSAPTCFDDRHVRISGTSMATPHVAGVAALLKQANPTYTPAQIKDRLKTTSTQLSGVTYNDEGAGEVNVKTAIPLVSKVTSMPDVWNTTTVPTGKTSTASQSFSVTSADTTVTSLTPVFSAPVGGITFSASKTTLNVSNKGTDTFTGTITVDNDLVPAGRYNGLIYLQSGGVNKGAIIVSITVTPTLTTTPTQLTYGVDTPSLQTWTSAPQTVTITNKRTDSAQTVSLASSSFITGITYTMSAQTLTIPANSSATVTTGFTVTNNSVSNGTYQGTLTISNATNNIRTATSFKKFYTIVLQGATDADLTGSLLYMHTQDNSETSGFIFPDTNPYTVYVNTPNAYDILTVYGWRNGEIINTAKVPETMTEGVVPGGTPTLLSKSNATRTVTILGTTIAGSTFNDEFTTDSTFEGVNGRASTGVKIGAMNINTYLINPTSSSYQFNLVQNSLANVNPYYTFGGSVQGGTGNATISNSVSDLKKTVVQYDLNKPVGSFISPLIYFCGLNVSVCGASYRSTGGITSSAQTMYVAPNLDYVYFSLANNNDSTDHLFRTGGFRILSQVGEVLPGASLTDAQQTYPVPDQKIYTGLGPTVWIARFANTSSSIVIDKLSTTPATPFRRQGFAIGAFDALPYGIYQNGTQVASGSFGPIGVYGWSFGRPLISAALPAGTYEFDTTYPYQDQGITLTGSVKATFNTGAVDPNPPSISRFYYYAGAARADVYDPTVTNKIEMDLNPEGGSMASVMLAIADDGGAYTNVPVTNTAGTTYSAILPTLSPSSKISLRITVTDAAGNTLVNTIELPKGSAPSASDTIPPTVSITYPGNGDTTSGASLIQATANDNVTVDHVDFYRGTTLLGGDATAPYSITWDSTSVQNGTYTLTARAYDSSGNSTTSAPVSVSVQNSTTGTPDTTPPTVSLTTPANSATLTGNAALSATASDNVAIGKVEFYQEKTLIATDTTGSPYAVSWDTTKVANGTYALTAKAYDTANNSATSSPVTITVNNSVSTPDTTPPTTTIISPVSGTVIKTGTIVPITTNSTDNVGVVKIQILVNNKVSCTTTTPNGCSWKVPNGPGKNYQLVSKAYDAAGNVGASSVVTITSSK